MEGKKFVQDVDKATDGISQFGKEVGHIIDDIVDKADEIRKDVANILDQWMRPRSLEQTQGTQ